MAADPLSRECLIRVLGQARLTRLVRAGWLKPCRQEPHRVLFDPHDVHAALRKLERQPCPPDRIEVARVRASERWNGHAYVRKEKKKAETVWDLDFSALS